MKTNRTFSDRPPGRTPANGSRALTLIELLVVISIIVILAGLLIPAVGRAGDSAKEMKCLSQLKRLTNALLLYAGENENSLPTGYGKASGATPARPVWQQSVHPYLNTGSAFSNRSEIGGAYQCPSIKQSDLTTYDSAGVSYAMNTYLLVLSTATTSLDPKRTTQFQSPARTVLLGDSVLRNADSLNPPDINGTPGNIAFRHRDSLPAVPSLVTQPSGIKTYGSNRATISFLDGHIESLTPAACIETAVWKP